MIFPGRMLANAEGMTIWRRHLGEGYQLHLVNRGVVVDLSPGELEALARLAAEALATAATPEEPKDHARRLQILQARINDYVRRERGTGAPGEA
jgi:hypothetical protein